MMLRLFYSLLLRLHPRPFRERFGAEILDIFEAPAPLAFRTLEIAGPGTAALVNGAILSTACFAGIAFAAAHGAGALPEKLIGAIYPRPNILAYDRSSITAATPTTKINIPEPALDPLLAIAEQHFRIIRVPTALDTDRDRYISAREISAAANLLAPLDLDHDGKLGPEECGFDLGNAKMPPEMLERAHHLYMYFNPVLKVLDADQNGEISALEITTAAASLTMLDTNRDGHLSPAEVLPYSITH